MAETPDNLLDARAIAQGEALGVLAREVVEGFLAGEHRSPLRGFAVEFTQHREYAPGDDLRHLDWKVLARTDRYYLKQYEQETNFVCHLMVDGSESMAYASGGGASKLEYSKRLAACIAYLVLNQRDAVSMRVFDSALRRYVPRTGAMSSIHAIMNTLAAYEPVSDGSGEGVGPALHELAAQTPRRGIVMLFSDLLENEEEILSGIRHCRFAGGSGSGGGGHEVVVFHVMDHEELEFSFEGNVEFEGLEGMGRVVTRPGEIRESYLRELRAFQERVRLALEGQRCHYVLVDTSRALADVLGEYLAFRERVHGR